MTDLHMRKVSGRDMSMESQPHALIIGAGPGGLRVPFFLLNQALK